MKKKCIIIAALVLFLDLYTKYLAVKYLKPDGVITIVDNFFYLIYLENTGASFGIMQGKRVFFIFITIAVVFGFVRFIRKNASRMTNRMYILFGVFLGGTLGNFFERVVNGYVVDFLSFHFFNFDFPVFNVADIAITVCVVFFTFLLLTNRVELDE